MNKVKNILIGLVFLVAILLRLFTFNQEGGDHRTFKRAVEEYRSGVNPYAYTVESFQREDLKHGYAYLPTLLYIQNFLVDINKFFNLDALTIYLWKVPVLLADIGVGFLIYYILRKEKFPWHIQLIGLIFWFLNPYFFMRYEYTNYDILPVFFLLLSLVLLNKKNFWSGVSFSLSVTLKTFPIILGLIYILKCKDLKKFIFGALITGILIILPFLKTPEDFNLMIRGGLLVHGDRGIQGRPFISFASYYLQNIGISFYQAEFSKIYTFIALMGAQLFPAYLYFKRKIKNIWVLILSSFTTYLLFTPVLNRTHLIWVIPFIYLGILNIYSKNYLRHYIFVGVIFVLMCGYYFLWDKGLKSPVGFGQKIWIDPVYEDRKRFGLLWDWYVRAVQWKKQLF